MDELNKLLKEFGNLSFDCGEWDGGDENFSEYNALLSKAMKTKNSIIKLVEGLLAEAHRSQGRQ